MIPASERERGVGAIHGLRVVAGGALIGSALGGSFFGHVGEECGALVGAFICALVVLEAWIVRRAG